jgi:hypothetical protein
MSQQIVPLTNNPNQTLQVVLAIDGTSVTLRLHVTYNSMSGYWVMDIADKSNNPLIVGIPLICGNYPAANLLAQQRYMSIGACYIINYAQVPTDSPDATNLGTDFLLLWDDTPNV